VIGGHGGPSWRKGGIYITEGKNPNNPIILLFLFTFRDGINFYINIGSYILASGNDSTAWHLRET